MPIFDYHCSKCNKQFEVIIDMNDENPQSCEVCGTEMERKFTPNPNLRIGDTFTFGRDKPPTREVAAKLEEIKADPSKDPYLKHREK